MKAIKINQIAYRKPSFTAAIALVVFLFLIVNISPVLSQSNSGNGAENVSVLYSSGHSGLPFDLKVYQNNPNPFSTTTSINFETSEFADLKLVINDQNGNLVKSYLFDNIAPGMHRVSVDGTDFPAGDYTYMFITGSKSESHKMSLVR